MRGERISVNNNYAGGQIRSSNHSDIGLINNQEGMDGGEHRNNNEVNDSTHIGLA